MLYELFQQEKLPNYLYDLRITLITESGKANTQIHTHTQFSNNLAYEN